MDARLWGKKIGMTQVFSQDRVIPVTVIDVANWLVTQVKTKENDGYNAVQMGCVRDRYNNESFSQAWVQNPKKYFSFIKEVRIKDEMPEVQVGQPVNFHTLLANGDKVDVVGVTKGCGFAGVRRRHDFNASPATHGSTLGRRPGSVGHMRRQGRVIKGKKLPGHMGSDTQMMKNLEVVRVEDASRIVLVKGSIPGKAGSLVFIRKA